MYTFSGYFFGSFPPGRFFATRLAGVVVKHMLIAHERAYNLIKSLPGQHLVFLLTQHPTRPSSEAVSATSLYQWACCWRLLGHHTIIDVLFNAVGGLNSEAHAHREQACQSLA